MEEFKIKTTQSIRKLLIIIFLLMYWIADTSGQQNTITSGGNEYGTGGSVSYSFGQIDYATTTGVGGSIMEGLQQPFEILVVSGSEETNINLILSVYPNPTKDFVVLSVQNFDTQNMTYLLYDVQGKLIEKQKLTGNQTYISLVDLANDIYFINVLNKSKELKKFKIIKNT